MKMNRKQSKIKEVTRRTVKEPLGVNTPDVTGGVVQASISKADVTKVVSKAGFSNKVIQILKVSVKYLIETGLWAKLGLTKYWQKAGIVLALAGSIWANVNQTDSTPEVIVLKEYIDSLIVVNTALGVNLAATDSMNQQLKETLELQGSAFEIVISE